MPDTAARAHDLHIARRRATFIAKTVLVRDCASTDISDDFHIGMQMGRKSRLWRNHVIIPHADCTPVHPCSVVITAE
jgi:hypothetical protein